MNDEPLEKIEAAFDRGVKRMTARPAKAAPVAFSCNERLQLQGTEATDKVSDSEPIYHYTSPTIVTSTSSFSQQYLCPDLLSIRQIGGADGWRGKVVRVFFRALKVVTGV